MLRLPSKNAKNPILTDQSERTTKSRREYRVMTMIKTRKGKYIMQFLCLLVSHSIIFYISKKKTMLSLQIDEATDKAEQIIVTSKKPTLLNESSSSSSLKSRGAAICLIQKWGLRYIDEWVDYHHALGFDMIYIYDNSDDFELKEWYEKRNIKAIEVIHYPGEAKQKPAYNECLKSIQERESHDWVAFFDLDEFLYIKDTNKFPHIMDVLGTLPAHAGSLAINWQLFGYNGQMKYEPKPVTFRFPGHEKKLNRHVKAIARVSATSEMDVHNVVRYTDKSYKAYDTSGNIVRGCFNDNLTGDVLVVNHFITKSVEEYRERCKRGRATTTREESDRSIHCVSGTDREVAKRFTSEFIIDDNNPWKLLKELVPEYSRFEE